MPGVKRLTSDLSFQRRTHHEFHRPKPRRHPHADHDHGYMVPARSTGGHPWIVAGVVVVPTFMEILDTTVANVALRYMAGGLSAAQSDAEWIITSYLAANAIVLPITGWLSAHLGRRNYFLLSIGVFTLASAMCGFATSLWQMILFCPSPWCTAQACRCR